MSDNGDSRLSGLILAAAIRQNGLKPSLWFVTVYSWRPVWLFVLFFLFIFGCNLPRDPNGTLEQVRNDTLRVGVSENPPWVQRVGDEPVGVEAALVQAFADDLNAHIEWQWGGTEEHMAALEHFELDLVIAGLTQSTPWSKRLGFTRPYYVETFTVGIPSGSVVLRELDGLRVAVKQGSSLADRLKAHDAVPVRLANLRGVNGPVAAPSWQLKAWRYVPTDLVLHRAKHVMAVPPGENGFLMRLERFLSDRTPSAIERLLVSEVDP